MSFTAVAMEKRMQLFSTPMAHHDSFPCLLHASTSPSDGWMIDK
jgi:hypothetical protein